MDCLEQALGIHGAPEVFNSDQGRQFTADAFTGALKAHGVAISMDGRGRALDNIFVERLWRSVKHGDIYLRGYAGPPELLVGLTGYFEILQPGAQAPVPRLPHAGPGPPDRHRRRGQDRGPFQRRVLGPRHTGAAPFRCE